MPTLKEIKGRIGSVKSTLKITSAMKLVSSAKLRKAQNAIEAMRPYEEALQQILEATSGTPSGIMDVIPDAAAVLGSLSGNSADNPDANPRPRVVVAIASNSSLCGGFNANVIAKVREVRKPGDVVYSIGRKMADAMRKDGFPSPEDGNALIEHPAYGPAAAMVEKLMEEQQEGRIGEVLLVYNHFVSTARQVPTVETLMRETPGQAGGDVMPGSDRASMVANPANATPAHEDFIIEPSRKVLREALEPKVLKLKLYAALLDSSAAEHAARTVAMQTATDNADNLLQELTLQYNKGRQQKITSEILDLAGGQSQD
ncbi:MAG: ATP synthase F1 subunit gamma [Bacteroidales bacterium]|nr:ATP synthase F1 subunit gamma [Bacteroidales bacterium]